MKILAFNSLKCPWSVNIKMQQTPLKFLPRAKWVGISTWLLPMHNKRQPHEKMISNKRSYASGLQSEAFDIRRITVIVKSVQNNRQMDGGFYERSFPSRWKCDWSAISGIGLSRDAINHKRNHCFPMRTCNLTKYHGLKHLIRVLMFWSFFSGSIFLTLCLYGFENVHPSWTSYKLFQLVGTRRSDCCVIDSWASCAKGRTHNSLLWAEKES